LYRPAVAAVELRPLALGEILDVAIKIYFRNALTFLKIVFLIVAPVSLVVSLIDVSAFPENTSGSPFDQPQPGEPVDFEETWTEISAVLVGVVLTIIASIISVGACFKAVADAYLGERPDWRSSTGFVFKRLHSLLWVMVLGGLAVVIGAVFCLIPGIWLFVSFSVAIPVLLTEALKGSRALGRSRNLVKGRWWQTFGILLLGYLLTSIVALVLGGLLAALLFTDVANEGIGYVVFNTIGNTVSSMLTTPLTAAFVTVIYFDLRIRKEGFDLQLLAERIGLPPRPEWAAASLPAAPAGPTLTTGGAQPPYWPPPPGWKPPAED
jgi:hypothetical protein